MTPLQSLIPDANILLQQIAPEQGDRYSPNLFRWLQAAQRRRRSSFTIPGVYSSKDGHLYIGWTDAEYLIAARLMGVLCNGATERTMAYVGQFRPLEGFWGAYAAIGRCAVDPDHKVEFLGGERWSLLGETRTCLWCGQFKQTLHRWTEAVERTEWRAQQSGEQGSS